MPQLMTDIPHAVCAAIRRVDNMAQVLLLKRANIPKNIWWLVAGGIEEGENAWQTAIREFREETGLVATEFYNADILETIYITPLDRVVIAPVFLAYVDADAQVKINDESLDFGWFSLLDAIDKVSFPGQKNIMRQLHQNYAAAKPDPFLRIK